MHMSLVLVALGKPIVLVPHASVEPWMSMLYAGALAYIFAYYAPRVGTIFHFRTSKDAQTIILQQKRLRPSQLQQQ